MAQKVFFDMTMSVDGFIAPDGMTMDHAQDPGYKNWLQKWNDMQSWILPLKFFRENLSIDQGGEEGAENDSIQATFKRTGASIMGANMFAGGEQFWPEEAPFHTKVFVLTHNIREPWERPGGTTFYFVNDGIESALRQAKEAAGDRDVRIVGGANVVQQYLNAGLVDEFTIHHSPIFISEGIPLLLNIDPTITIRIKQTLAGDKATHVTYEVVK
jgi:dihydrofolate reductase